MNAVLLARIQFAFTIGFHYIFPLLTIGLAWLIVWFMTKYKNNQNEANKKYAHFWIELFALSFVVGVASGIVMEFQFGTNWSEYSRFVGGIFGIPLAAEVIFAFFLESAFIGVLLFGWNRFSAKTLWFSSLMVAIGSTLSAFWIVAANSWQQTPSGYQLVNGRPELTDFFAALFNPSTLPRFLHVLDGAIITGAFFMLGVSAWFILKKKHITFAKESFKIALIVGFVASVLQIPLGHYHGVQVAYTQPEKLAAIEGIFETQPRAPLLLFGIPDEKNETLHGAIKLPGMLSLLAYGDINTVVKGLKDFPRDEWPPLLLTFISFHIMVALGLFFIAMSGFGFLLLCKKTLFESQLFMKIAFWSIPLPFIANELGWVAAEVGRQPWAVYHLLKTKDAVSISVPAEHVLFSLVMFSLIYALLFFMWIYLLKRKIKSGP